MFSLRVWSSWMPCSPAHTRTRYSPANTTFSTASSSAWRSGRECDDFRKSRLLLGVPLQQEFDPGAGHRAGEVIALAEPAAEALQLAGLLRGFHPFSQGHQS